MLKEINAKILNDMLHLLDQLSLQQFSESLSSIHNKSIGDHIRHIIEFYACILENPNVYVNYDERERNLVLASQKKEAVNKIKYLQTRLHQLDLDSSITLKQSFEGETLTIESTYQRELLYNLEHTIHHLAIIKIAIDLHFTNINLVPNFGVAFSTISYEENAK